MPNMQIKPCLLRLFSAGLIPLRRYEFCTPGRGPTKTVQNAGVLLVVVAWNGCKFSNVPLGAARTIRRIYVGQ